MARGTIHDIQIALGIGDIRPDDGGADLPFDRGALAAGAFEELREGQWVAFEATPGADERLPARARAIRPLEE